MEKIKITYEDFKIGQIVTCQKVDPSYEEWLEVGKQYVISDVDFHFPDSICIDHYYNKKWKSGFFPIKFFVDEVAEIREKKLNQILGDETNKFH